MDVSAKVEELIRFEDTVLHAQWKKADVGGSFEVITSSEEAARKEYVPLANGWLEKVVEVLKLKSDFLMGPRWFILEPLYVKILGRRDELVRRGYGAPTPGAESLLEKAAEKITGKKKDELADLLRKVAVLLVVLILVVAAGVVYTSAHGRRS